MFRLLHFGLQRWARWRVFDTRLDGNILLYVGSNGSGKTSLVNALRILLGIENLPDGMDIEHYVKNWPSPSLLWAVVTNPSYLRRRAFSHSKCHSEAVTLVCVINPKPGTQREFYSIDGALDAKRVLSHVQAKKGIGLRDYQAALKNAGFTPQLKSLFTIDQGDVKTICKRSPRLLFDYVIKGKGSAPIIVDYENARATYKEAETEHQDTRSSLNNEKKILDNLRVSLDEFTSYEDALKEREFLETQFVQATYVKHQSDERELLSQIKTKEGLVTGAQNRERILSGEIETLTREREAKRLEFAPLDAKAREIGSRLSDAKAHLKLHSTVVEQLEQRPKPPEETGQQAALITEAAGFRAKAELLVSDANGVAAARDDVARQREAIKKGGNLEVPEDAASIGGTAWLGTHIEPEEEWRLALAAVLRDELRSVPAPTAALEKAIIVVEENSPLAVHLGPVAEAPPTGLFTVAKVLRPLPQRIVELMAATQPVRTFSEWDSTKFERAVTLSGTIVSANEARTVEITADWLGGRESQLQRLDAELERLAEKEDTVRAEADQLLTSASQLEKRAEAAAAWSRWLEEERKLADARGQVTLWTTERDAQAELEKEVRAAVNPLEARIRDISIKLAAELEPELQALHARLPQLEEDAAKAHAALSEAQRAIAAIRTRDDIDPKILEPDRLRDVPPLADVVEAYEGDRGVVRRISAMEDNPAHCRDPDIKRKHHLKHEEVRGLSLELKEREEAVDRALTKLREVENDYYAFVMQIVNQYKKRFTELASLGGISVKVETENVRNFKTLDQAELHIEVGFRGKAPAPISTLSGGQKTITSILLVLAMSESGDEQGLFVVDEPYADLDLSNIIMVSDFLRSTGSQYLLTVPTNVNKETYLGADIQLTLQIQEGDTKEAERPFVAITRR